MVLNIIALEVKTLISVNYDKNTCEGYESDFVLDNSKFNLDFENAIKFQENVDGFEDNSIWN